MKFLSKELSPAEASFLKWQYGLDEADQPFDGALWQAIMRAWEADHAPGAGGAGSEIGHLARLGSKDAYPEEVALFTSFKSAGGDKLWNDLIRRAGLSDRRTAKVVTAIDRRRGTAGKAGKS